MVHEALQNTTSMDGEYGYDLHDHTEKKIADYPVEFSHCHADDLGGVLDTAITDWEQRTQHEWCRDWYAYFMRTDIRVKQEYMIQPKGCHLSEPNFFLVVLVDGAVVIGCNWAAPENYWVEAVFGLDTKNIHQYK